MLLPVSDTDNEEWEQDESEGENEGPNESRVIDVDDSSDDDDVGDQDQDMDDQPIVNGVGSTSEEEDDEEEEMEDDWIKFLYYSIISWNHFHKNFLREIDFTKIQYLCDTTYDLYTIIVYEKAN